MEPMTIVFWVMLVILLLLFFAFLSKAIPQNEESVANITFDGLIIAIIIIMGLVPQVGYITVVPGLSLTLVHLPVLVGAYRGGAKRGALFGFVFGLTSMFQAISNPVGFNAFFVYPWVSILPRLVFGLLAGLLFTLIKKMPKIGANGFAVGALSFLLTMMHTGLVFLDLFIFYPSTMSSLFQGTSSIGEGIVIGFGAVIALGCLGESALASLFTPLIGKSIRKIERKEA